MKKLRLLKLLSLTLIVATLIFVGNFLNAEIFAEGPIRTEPSPVKSLNKNAKNVVNKDVIVKDNPEQFPEIFFQNADFNFGKVFKGEKVEHVFTFENRGNGTLDIKKVKSSCGCTAAILTNKTILPGETGEIKTVFSTGAYNGKVTKSITVKSNDPKNLSYKLSLSGEIREAISTKPKRINFGSTPAGEKIVKSVSITSDSDFTIKKITPSKPFMNASVKEEIDMGYIINVTLKSGREPGRFSGVINLETDNKNQPMVKIPFFGEVAGDLTVYPEKIYFGDIIKGKGRVQKVFAKLNGEDIKILDVKASPDYLNAEIVENYKENKSQFLIEVSLREDAATGAFNGLLEIKTNSEIQSSITIPITGNIMAENTIRVGSREEPVITASNKKPVSSQDDHATGSPVNEEKSKDKPKGTKTLTPSQLEIRLAGIVMIGNEYVAIIEDETADNQVQYRKGESVKGNTIITIGKDIVVLGKNGRNHVLKITQGGKKTDTSRTVSKGRNIPSSSGASVITSSFQPTYSETGPPANPGGTDIPLPEFKPVFNKTGPAVDRSMPVEELPHFEPVTNKTGPPLDPEGKYEELPAFTPVVSENGPPVE